MTNDRAQILITAVDQTKSAFDSIRGNLKRLGEESNRVQTLLAGLGVTLSAGGFVAFVKGAIDTADQLNKLSQKIGISVEALSTLRFAAELSDVSLETLQKGIKTLSQTIVEANSGIGDGVKVFDALGISVKNTDGTLESAEQVLLEVADVFAILEDGTVKTTLAVELFGKAGQDMIPLLNQGKAGIEQLRLEAERLGLKLTTETARSAETFNDNLATLRASASSLGIALSRDFLPELTNITNAMRLAANEAGVLKALWVGLGGIGNLIFNGTEIQQARKEIERLQDLVNSTRQKLATGKAKVPWLPFDVQFNEQALTTLQRNLGQWEQELAQAKKRLDDLTLPKQPELPKPTASPTEDMQRIACIVSGGQWVNGQCLKKSEGRLPQQDTLSARLALLKTESETELKLIKEGLELAQKAYDRALDDRLISIRDFYAAKTVIDQQAIDAQINTIQRELSTQSKLANQGRDENERLRAMGAVKKLEGELTILNQQRTEIEIANSHATAKAEKALADELSKVRERLTEIRGEADSQVSRERLQREYQPLLEQLRAAKDAQGESDVLHLIDVQSDLASLSKLETQFQATLARMHTQQDSINIKRQSGLLTEIQAREQIRQLMNTTADELDVLIPKMEALGSSVGDQAVAKVAGLKNEVARLRIEVDEFALRFQGATKNALAGFFTDIMTGSENAFFNMVQNFRNAIAAILAERAATRIVDSLLGSISSVSGEGFFGGLLKTFGFAEGGYTGDGGKYQPAGIVHAGEYVFSAASVRRLGLAALDSLHRLSKGAPVPIGPRLGYAEGGLVESLSLSPAAAPTVNQSVRIVNSVDPRITKDFLASSEGEKVILNIISRNTAALKQVLA
jgi:lambda family phage tail tape measure protein